MMFKLSNLFLLWCWPFLNLAQQNTTLPEGRGRAHFIYHPKSQTMLLIDGYANYLTPLK